MGGRGASSSGGGSRSGSASSSGSGSAVYVQRESKSITDSMEKKQRSFVTKDEIETDYEGFRRREIESKAFSGKVYTNDEFMAHLSQYGALNGKLKRSILDNKLTNKELEYLKDNSKLQYGRFRDYKDWGIGLQSNSNRRLRSTDGAISEIIADVKKNARRR